MGRRAKPVTFKIVVPPSAARVEQMGRFLVEAALKKEGLTAKITPVKRGPGDPILTIVPPETAGKSASA